MRCAILAGPLFSQVRLKKRYGGKMKITGIRCVCLCLSAGALSVCLAEVKSPTAASAAAPAAVRAEAREIFAAIVGIESSIGKGNVPRVAKYLADRFKAGGFPAADIHILPLGETASLVVRYRGNGSGGGPLRFLPPLAGGAR